MGEVIKSIWCESQNGHYLGKEMKVARTKEAGERSLESGKIRTYNNTHIWSAIVKHVTNLKT